MNRVVIQEGYSLPFDGTRRKRRSSKRRRRTHGLGAFRAQQSKMKSCAKAWSGHGSYRAHMKKCLKG